MYKSNVILFLTKVNDKAIIDIINKCKIIYFSEFFMTLYKIVQYFSKFTKPEQELFFQKKNRVFYFIIYLLFLTSNLIQVLILKNPSNIRIGQRYTLDKLQ